MGRFSVQVTERSDRRHASADATQCISEPAALSCAPPAPAALQCVPGEPAALQCTLVDADAVAATSCTISSEPVATQCTITSEPAALSCTIVDGAGTSEALSCTIVSCAPVPSPEGSAAEAASLSPLAA